ncbi:hypothetical protein Sipo8835_09290 [Streptomyces ipomoeae]|uniref:Uncharacterized protein n=1 Tax=Streptomyces ipomoeae TaxID=103232 RepID=A0AAE9B256_9ACTN|nr:hypothetical protein [Streptomyces ipomoeae]TQE36852.1 hypothetical protein Sipo8835_09290 [Streptomyces ipomoeae]
MAENPIPFRYRQLLVTDSELSDWRLTRSKVDNQIVGATGSCPNCHHTTELSPDDSFDSFMTMGQSGALPALAPSARMTRICNCACAEEHFPEGSEEPATGCGSWWLVTMALDPAVVPPVRAATDAALLPALRAVQEVTATEEATLRSSAEKWIAAVTALLGLFGLAGVVVGKDAFTGMSSCARIVAGSAAGLAVIGAAIALFSVHRAAYGWPVEVDISNDHLLTTWFKTRRRRLKEAADQLRLGVVCGLCSLGALVVALACIWFWPRQSPQGPRIEVTLDNDTKICGTLLESKTNGELRIQRPDGHVETFPGADLRTVKSAGSCPP